MTDDETVRAAAVAIAQRLEAALADSQARSIVLTRDEALIALGIINGVAKLIERGTPE